jgi:hypothetical protein
LQLLQLQSWYVDSGQIMIAATPFRCGGGDHLCKALS